MATRTPDRRLHTGDVGGAEDQILPPSELGCPTHERETHSIWTDTETTAVPNFMHF